MPSTPQKQEAEQRELTQRLTRAIERLSQTVTEIDARITSMLREHSQASKPAGQPLDRSIFVTINSGDISGDIIIGSNNTLCQPWHKVQEGDPV